MKLEFAANYGGVTGLKCRVVEYVIRGTDGAWDACAAIQILAPDGKVLTTENVSAMAKTLDAAYVAVNTKIANTHPDAAETK